MCTSPPLGFVSNSGDCDDTSGGIHPGATEVWYDGVDQDCDGGSDYDQDVDGHDASTFGGTDCDDTDPDVFPGATEMCNGGDDDCDGLTDEGDNVFHRDFDGDLHGDPLVSVSLVCTSPPTGYVSDDTDCDDTDDSVHPGATETWYDGVDQDCDGESDFDQDADGYDASTFGGTDCDDTDPGVFPGATEMCNGEDDDCDGLTDEGDNVFHRDFDGDLHGDPLVSVSLVCTSPPSGFVSDATDCDDSVSGHYQGSTCDDGNTATSGDVLNSACVCAGTVTCTTNPVVLSITTDANAAQITWYVMLTGTNTEVCTGDGLASSSTIALDCCLPNGCYDLVVTDDFGDGINPGGYVLRDGSGKRIIDNAGNGAGFTSLSLSHLGFCVPLGTDALMASSCDVETATLSTVLRAEPNAAVTAQFGVHNANSGYQFWVTNPNGGYSRRIFLSHSVPGTGAPGGTASSLKASYFALSSMNSSAPLIPQGILLNVRVRTQVNGVYNSFGPACRLKIPEPTCATTQLTTTANPVVSCGATGLTFSSSIWATYVAGATGYQFEFSKPGYNRRILSPSRSQALSFVTVPLQMNNCYQVRVRISYDNSATYCPFGPYCTITLGTATCSGGTGMALEPGTDGPVVEEVRMSLWPNPNEGSVVNLSLTDFDTTVNTVSVDVTDVFGKLVATRTLAAQDGYLNTTMDFGPALAPGLYLVNVTVGEQRYTERLVIQ